MSSFQHKARRRKKPSGAPNSEFGNAVLLDGPEGIPKPAFPLASFLWPARKSTSQWVILPLILMTVGLFRWTTGFWGYSGEKTLIILHR